MIFLLILLIGSVEARAAENLLREVFSKITPSIKRVKLDIGLSYNAPESQCWLSKENDLLVFGFEPNPDSVEIIKAGNIKKQNAAHGNPIEKKYLDEGRFVLLPIAIANILLPTELEFYMTTGDCGTSSLFKPKNFGIKNKVMVKAISLKFFFDNFPWDKIPYIEFIKIDSQGADLDILKSAGIYLNQKVVYVTAEPGGDGYENANYCSKNEITRFMLSQGFVPIKHPNTVDPTFINKKYLHL